MGMANMLELAWSPGKARCACKLGAYSIARLLEARNALAGSLASPVGRRDGRCGDGKHARAAMEPGKG